MPFQNKEHHNAVMDELIRQGAQQKYLESLYEISNDDAVQQATLHAMEGGADRLLPSGVLRLRSRPRRAVPGVQAKVPQNMQLPKGVGTDEAKKK